MTDEAQINLFEWSTQSPATPPSGGDGARIPTSAQVPIPPGTYTHIEALAQDCRQCQRCDLSQTRTHVVVSRGSPQAPLMIIGEGPGQQEDETGLPFVGRAGQLLEKILAAVQLEPERDTYICNMVKCRPPGNRTPTPDETAACRPYLLEQIRLVNPKIILLTGATAVKGLTGDKRGITKIRGQWITWQNHLCMPILHPAYLLRNPSRKPGSPKWLMWQDIQLVKAKLNELIP
ncbi:uracil-DNA glycosylase [Synechococcales cyanobacterium C]|uniref:Type-4 uracil-DNA glycosylase n=1 Tax=Petrachloros mirabilis ULC683 TaxID=2781853 RepID=A0A8K2A046_9CYAN|nr:uracil-DNA glycosylase [Petrachloros mirabilis]NCJ08520.1 uracil-DNA glycosylase [Petrachloros mirabilis ULC683]